MKQVATILLVEDDAAAAAEFTSAVSDMNATIWYAESAADARSILRNHRPDLIVLDLSLPDVDGLVLCANLKTEAADVPFMVCSVGSTPEKVLSFKLGAEDFVAKPYTPAELQVRVEAILKRHARRKAAEFAALGVVGDGPDIDRLRVDLARWRVTVDDRLLNLTPTEFHLLVFMARRPGEIISRQELARGAWGDENMSRSRTIDAYVRRIANKLAESDGPSQEGPPRILNIRGLGYQLSVPHVSAA